MTIRSEPHRRFKTHGLSGYQNYGCRCEVCRSAASLYRREQYHKHLALERSRSRPGREKRESEERKRAGRWIETALRNGSLQRPTTCEECGAEPGEGRSKQSMIQAHIADAAYPELHEWLCTLCAGRRWRRR